MHNLAHPVSYEKGSRSQITRTTTKPESVYCFSCTVENLGRTVENRRLSVSNQRVKPLKQTTRGFGGLRSYLVAVDLGRSAVRPQRLAIDDDLGW